MKSEFTKLMFDFLKKTFPIKKKRNDVGRLTRMVVVESGFVRSHTMNYKWRKGVDLTLIYVDLIQTLIYVFACTEDEATEVVKSYYEKFRF